MLSFIKKLFGGSTPATEAPYKVETPAPAEATTEQRYVGENEQGAVYETVVVVPEAVAPAMTPIPLAVEQAPAAKPAKKPRAKKPAAPKAPKAAKPKAPKAPKAK